MKKPSLKSALVAFFGSRTAVGEGSLKAWGAQQRPPVGASTAEALADELVAEGVASVEERSGGRRVWRLVREEPTEPEPVPEEEPVAVAGAEEPCQRCAALVRERDAFRAELGAGLGDALQRTADLAREVMTLRQERDLARGEIFGLESRLTEVKTEADAYYEALCLIAPDLRGTSPSHLAEGARQQVANLRRQLEAPPATLDQGAVAHYLLSLPEERWGSLATARKQLARAREMALEAQRLEASALAAVDGLLSAPAEAPVPSPAPELAPAEQAPQAKRGPRTEDGEPRPGTRRAEILAWIRQQPNATARVVDVAERFDEQAADISAVLIGMTRAGYLRRTGPGIYQAVKP